MRGRKKGRAWEAKLQPGVIGSVKSCTGSWCRVIVALPQKSGDVDGYIRQDPPLGGLPQRED